MTGHLQKKGNIWYAVVSINCSSGKREKQKWISTKCTSKTDANKVLRDILTKFENETYVDKNALTFVGFATDWLENIHKMKVQITSYDATKIVFYAHIKPFFEKILLQDIKTIQLQKYFNEMAIKGKKDGTGLCANTLHKHKIIFKAVFDYAVKNKLIVSNPVANVELPKKEKFIGKFYTAEQLEELIEVTKGMSIETVVFLTAHYGFRRGEVLGLKWDNIDFKSKIIRIEETRVRCANGEITKKPKNESSRRTLPMIEVVEEYLKKLKKKQLENKLMCGNTYLDNNYVCCWDNGTLQSTNYISHKFNQVLKDNNMPQIRFHDLRHSTASYLLKLGFSLKEIQVWLGHSDISTTANIYAHVDMEMKQNVADKLNKLTSKKAVS